MRSNEQIEKFKFWAHKVLPLVYDDSLSYYEFLCKVVQKLNEVIESTNITEENMEELIELQNQLQEFVNTYFENLDVQQEIDHKLDEMVEDGTFDRLITPIVEANVGENLSDVVANQIGGVVADQIDEVVSEQIDAVVASQIGDSASEATGDWLEQNVNPVGSAVTVDKSLTIAGSASDAKVVGEFREGFNATLNEKSATWTLINGEYIKADGTGTGSSAKYCRTNLFSGYPARTMIKLSDSNYEYRVSWYDSTGVVTTGVGFIGVSEYAGSDNIHYLPEGAEKYGLTIRRVNQANLTTTDITNIKNALHLYWATDDSLTKTGKPADAKVVGDNFSDVWEQINLIGGSTTFDTPLWYVGGLNDAMNNTGNSNYKARLSAQNMPVIPSDYTNMYVWCPPEYQMRVAYYNEQRLGSLITLASSSSVNWYNGLFRITPTYFGKYIDIDLRKTNGEEFDSSEMEGLKTAIQLVAMSAVGDTTELRTYSKDTLVHAINNVADYMNDVGYKDITDVTQYDFQWSSTYFIQSPDGAYVRNTNYPYLFGNQVFIRAEKENPYVFTMGSDEFDYALFFYSEVSTASYIGVRRYFKGSTKFTFDGDLNGLSYKAVRISICTHNHDTGAEAFERCTSAVKMYSPNGKAFRVPGTYGYNKFYVTVNLDWCNVDSTSSGNAESLNERNIQCKLALPTTYRSTGKPCPLVMLGHGATGHITDDTWYNAGDAVKYEVEDLNSAGYAVFDVDNTRSEDGGFPDWGNLPLMTAYIKAWEYIKRNYNVEDRLFLFSASMGTCASLNMMKWYGSKIACAIQLAPRPICELRYNDLGETRRQDFAEGFGLVNGVWDNSKLNGFQQCEALVDVGGTKMSLIKYPPIKVLVGKADTGYITQVREFYKALNDSGTYVSYREITGLDHYDVTFLQNYPDLRAECVNFFNRFR